MQLFLYISFALFVTIEVVLSRRFRATETDKKDSDKKSLLLLWGTILTSIAIAVFVAKTTLFPITSDLLTYYGGLCLLYLGIIIRLFAVYTLGKFFTVDVTIREGHRLKKDGLFKWVRHPNYSALLLSFFGMALTFNNWISLLILMVPIVVAFSFRISIEEKVLLRHFGDEYASYCRNTKRLIPFLY